MFFRQEDGTAVALEDKCAHRHAPLSEGKLVGDLIQCPYHGLEYNANGDCVRVPGQSSVPPGCRVRSYPVVERNHWIWLWMGDPALANPDDIEDFHWMDDPEWRAKGELALGTPFGIVHPVEIFDIVGVGERRITHPQPDPMIAFDHRVRPYPAARRHTRLARHSHAIAVGIVFEPVIWALDQVADQLAFGQRRMPVCAFVFERDSGSILLTEEHHWLIQQRASMPCHPSDQNNIAAVLSTARSCAATARSP